MNSSALISIGMLLRKIYPGTVDTEDEALLKPELIRKLNLSWTLHEPHACYTKCPSFDDLTRFGGNHFATGQYLPSYLSRHTLHANHTLETRLLEGRTYRLVWL